MDGDRPILRKEDDRLGFTPIAAHLARAIADQPAEQGFVLGIEGKWGSGKSTLINLAIEQLKAVVTSAPEIVSFSPWLVGDRDELLSGLFDELAAAALKIDPRIEAEPESTSWLRKALHRNEHWKLKQRERLRKNLQSKLKVFGFVAGSFGKMSKAAGPLLPLGGLAGTALEGSADALKEFAAGGSVSKRKDGLVAALKLLTRKIVVFIDDLDRLEPREASEVLRLIRAVADFPNIVYVLSYDPDVVAQTLSKAIQVDDGAAFLEKIVQVSFRVPRPQAFDLRRWFKAEVQKLFAEELASAGSSQDLASRLSQVIDLEGGRYLRTGRDVVRALNALRLHAIPVRKEIDISDAVWLQLVRIGNREFYKWIEEYVVDVAVVSSGARVTTAEDRAMSRRLQAILEGENREIVEGVFELQEMLPGILPPAPNEELLRVFQDLNAHNLDEFIQGRRLGSPNHSRLYYAFSQPSGSVPNEQVQAFVEMSAQMPDDAKAMLARLSSIERPQGGTTAEVLIDRLQVEAERVPVASIPGIISALADNLDLPAFSTAQGDFGNRPVWDAASRVAKRLMKRATGEIRAASIRNLFVEGKSLGWLTSLFRSETFAHGHYGERRTSEDRWLLTDDEYAEVRRVMLSRYREMPPLDLMQVPQFLNLLYAWKQASGTDEAREWVETHTITNRDLLTFLSRVRGWSASSNRGVYYPLRKADLALFLDFDVALQRVKEIASDPSSDDADRQLASELLEATIQGNE